jgi:hypothetical protein
MAVVKSSTRKMYTQVNDTEAPGSRESKKKFRFMSSSAALGDVSVNCVQPVFTHALVALPVRSGKWLTRPVRASGIHRENLKLTDK